MRQWCTIGSIRLRHQNQMNANICIIFFYNSNILVCCGFKNNSIGCELGTLQECLEILCADSERDHVRIVKLRWSWLIGWVPASSGQMWDSASLIAWLKLVRTLLGLWLLVLQVLSMACATMILSKRSCWSKFGCRFEFSNKYQRRHKLVLL